VGQPAVIIVGLPDAAVKESRDRVKTAIENSGFKYVTGHTTINLAPARLNLREYAPFNKELQAA
jgi:magnesium chelatase family protein